MVFAADSRNNNVKINLVVCFFIVGYLRYLTVQIYILSKKKRALPGGTGLFPKSIENLIVRQA